MKKFSNEVNKIQETFIKTEKELLKDKLSEILDKEISVEINKEPKVEENYSIEGKKELFENIISLLNYNNEIVKEQYTKIYENKYKITINKEEIDIIIESLKNTPQK